MILSILICTIPERKESFNSLMFELIKQSGNMEDVEILYNIDEGTIGKKRNQLLNNATGEYVCFIDDDDEVSSTYIIDILNGLKNKPDCLSLRGVITWDNKNMELFEHSIRYNSYKTTNNVIKYERYPNHLNTIKTSIAKQFKFPETNFGEDTDWATQIHQSGLLKKEIFIDKILYHYNYVTNKGSNSL